MNKHTFQRVTSQNSVKVDSKPLNLLLAEVNMVGANTHIWQKEYQTLNSQMKTRCTTTKALVYSSPLLFSKTSGTVCITYQKYTVTPFSYTLILILHP